MNKKTESGKLGWKWYDYIIFLIIPFSILVSTIVALILTLQLFTDFNLETFRLAMLSLLFVTSYIVMLYKLKNKKRAGLYLYLIVSAIMIFLNIYFRKNLFGMFSDIIRLVLEIIYFYKRIEYFS